MLDLCKTRPEISNECVSNQPRFKGLTFHNKYIDTDQKCNSASANCLCKRANELCTFDVEGKCKRAGTNYIDGLQQCRVYLLSFFLAKKVNH